MKYGTGKEGVVCHLAVLQLPVCAAEKTKGIELTIQSLLALLYL